MVTWGSSIARTPHMHMDIHQSVLWKGLNDSTRVCLEIRYPQIPTDYQNFPSEHGRLWVYPS